MLQSAINSLVKEFKVSYRLTVNSQVQSDTYGRIRSALLRGVRLGNDGDDMVLVQ